MRYCPKCAYLREECIHGYVKEKTKRCPPPKPPMPRPPTPPATCACRIPLKRLLEAALIAAIIRRIC